MKESLQINDTSSTDRVISVRPGSRFNKWYVKLLVGAFFLSVGVFVYPNYQNWRSTEISYERERVRIAEVTRGAFEQSISIEGKIIAIVKPTLYSPAEGTISMLVKPGDFVKKGVVVARIYRPELEVEVEQGKKQVEAEKLELERQILQANQTKIDMDQSVELAKIRHDAAQRKLSSYNELASRSIVSKLEYEASQDETLVAVSELKKIKLNHKLMNERAAFEIKAKRLQVERQESVLNDLLRQFDEMSIRSPIDGQVGTVSVEERDSVAKNQSIITIVDLTAFGVEMEIPEIYAGVLQTNLPTIVNYNGKDYKGQLSLLSPEIVNNKFEARAKFIEIPDAELKQRQRVSVKILISKKDDAIKVQRGPFVDSGGGKFAYRVDGNIAEIIPIKLGELGSSEVEILQGVRAGDKIIISGTEVFNNASKVLLR